jgi:type IV secretory pathway TrbD component
MRTMEEASSGRQQSPSWTAMRLGGALAVVGGLGYGVGLLLHGDLPDETAELALTHIAARGEWRALKLGLLASLTCWVGAFVALARSMPEGVSGLLARWAVASAIVGLSLVAVEYAIIGHALKDVALAWQAGVNPEDNLRMGTVMLAVSGGLFHSVVIWMLGLPYLLLGAAIAVARGPYPRWLGWLAGAAGAGALVSGATRFLGLALVPYPLLYGGFVLPLSLWLAGVGVLMWLRAPSTTRRPAGREPHIAPRTPRVLRRSQPVTD